MPTPRRNETHDQFIERCIPVVIDDGTAEGPRQARAICESMWQNRDTRETRSEASMTHVKSVQGSVKALDERGHGTAVIATLNTIDKDGDVTVPGAIGEQTIQMVPAHNWSHVPIGKGRTREEGEEVLVDFTMNLDSESGREWHSALMFDLQSGPSVQQWSYGFTVNPSGAEMSTMDGQQVQVLKSLDVHEFSPVLLGAGEGTRTLELKNHAEAEEGSKRFADQIKQAISDIDDIAERAEGIRERRQKEGRDISPNRIEQLSQLRKSLAALAGKVDDIDALVGEAKQSGDDTMSESQDEQPDAEALRLQFEHVQAKHGRKVQSDCPSGFCKVDGTSVKGEQLSRLLRSLRDSEDVTNGELAQQSGRSQSTVSDVVTGEINCPPMDVLEAFAEVLGVPSARLRRAAERDGCTYEATESD